VVRRVDNSAPIESATIRIKATGLTRSKILAETTTSKDGTFRISVSVARKSFVCEASAIGLALQQVLRTINMPTCEFELESLLTLSDLARQSPVKGRGPGLSLTANTNSQLTISDLTVRLHLTKPASCGSGGTTQQYDLGGTVAVSLGKASGTIVSDGKEFQVTGEAPLRPCEETEISLHVEPAATLQVGGTQILITLPETLTLKQESSARLMSLAQLGLKATYRSTIDRIDVELVTSRGSKASAQLPGLSIPVGVAK
jgi:hypothetical protein